MAQTKRNMQTAPTELGDVRLGPLSLSVGLRRARHRHDHPPSPCSLASSTFHKLWRKRDRGGIITSLEMWFNALLPLRSGRPARRPHMRQRGDEQKKRQHAGDHAID